MDQSGPIYFIFSFFKIKNKVKSTKEFPNPTQNVFLGAMQSFNTAPGFPQLSSTVQKVVHWGGNPKGIKIKNKFQDAWI